MCCHHWMLDSKNYGICNKCLEVRQFHPELSTTFRKLPHTNKVSLNDSMRLSAAKELVHESAYNRAANE